MPGRGCKGPGRGCGPYIPILGIFALPWGLGTQTVTQQVGPGSITTSWPSQPLTACLGSLSLQNPFSYLSSRIYFSNSYLTSSPENKKIIGTIFLSVKD